MWLETAGEVDKPAPEMDLGIGGGSKSRSTDSDMMAGGADGVGRF
jgi:hypothetical protein